MERISPHISWKEATHSAAAIRHGIKNEPGPDELRAMRALAEHVFEPLRRWVGGPIGISSFYRSEALNTILKGSTSSQHIRGQAVDLDMDMIPDALCTNAELFHHIRERLPFDQLIWEYGTSRNPAWVHVSYKLGGGNRRQAIRATRDPRHSSGTRYQLFIP